jgi:hypothetical protein
MFTKNESFEGLVDQEIALTERKRKVEATLKELEAAQGDAYLENPDAFDAGPATRAELELKGITRAIAVVRSRRPGVVEKENRDQAAILRAEASVKRRELENITNKSEKLFAAISKLEEFDISSGAMLQLDPSTPWGGRVIPKSRRLLVEVESIEAVATYLETAKLAESTPAEGFSLENVIDPAEIVRGVLLDRSSAGPSAEAVTDWLAALEGIALKRSVVLGSARKDVRLYWASGTLDPNSSFVRAGSTKEEFRVGTVPGLAAGGPNQAAGLWLERNVA